MRAFARYTPSSVTTRFVEAVDALVSLFSDAPPRCRLDLVVKALSYKVDALAALGYAQEAIDLLVRLDNRYRDSTE